MPAAADVAERIRQRRVDPTHDQPGAALVKIFRARAVVHAVPGRDQRTVRRARLGELDPYFPAKLRRGLKK